jgi:hypothetical protein
LENHENQRNRAFQKKWEVQRFLNFEFSKNHAFCLKVYNCEDQGDKFINELNKILIMKFQNINLRLNSRKTISVKSIEIQGTYFLWNS